MNSTNPILKIGQEGEIDLGVLGSNAVYSTDQRSEVTFQISPKGSETWATNAVVTIKFSNDGVNFYNVGTDWTFTAADLSNPLRVLSCRYVAAEVTTAGTSSVIARVHTWGGIE